MAWTRNRANMTLEEKLTKSGNSPMGYMFPRDVAWNIRKERHGNPNYGHARRSRGRADRSTVTKCLSS